MDPIKLARLKALRALVAGGSTLSSTGSTELAELENEATSAGVDEAAVEAAADAEPDLSVLEGDGDEGTEGGEGEGSGDGTTPPADPPAQVDPPAADPPVETADEVAELRRRAEAAEAEATRLRGESVEGAITELRSRGAIVDVIEEDALALLRHSDEDVRRRAGAILGNMAERVNLSRRPGRTDLDRAAADGGSEDAPTSIDLAMPGEEFGEWWAALESEQRAALRASGEYDKYMKHRRKNGIVD